MESIMSTVVNDKPEEEVEADLVATITPMESNSHKDLQA